MIRKHSGFTFVELMIAFFLLSLLSMGIFKYFKGSTQTLVNAQGSQESSASIQRIQKLLRTDIQEAVYLNPSCDTNPAPGVTVTTLCSNLKILSGVIPFPGHTVDDMDALTDLSPPSNLTDAPSSLGADEYDAVRIMQFDFSGAFNCRLNRDRRINPLLTADVGDGNEVLYADPSCDAVLEEGRIYVLTEVFDNDSVSTDDSDLETFSNLFQITDKSTNALEVTITASSEGSNIYNQPHGLGLSGFSNLARIYPVRFVEWAYQPPGGARQEGIYRRVISPAGTDLIGKQEWKLVEPQGVGLQFMAVTFPPSGPVVHNRTMQFESDTGSTDYDDNNGVEDIRALIPYVVVRAQTPRNDGKTFDNPLTAAVESSNYPMSEVSFRLNLRNAPFDRNF